MNLVRALPVEATLLTQLTHAAKRHWGYPAAWIDAWRDQLTITPEWISTHDTWKAVDGLKLVGFMSWTATGRRARLEHLWVLPEAMGHGVGRQLFLHAASRAGAAGWPMLEITSDPNAAGFYHRMGAVQIGETDGETDGVPRVLPVLEFALSNGRVVV